MILQTVINYGEVSGSTSPWGYALYKGIPYVHDIDYMTGSNSDEFIGTKKLLAGNLSWARIHTSPNRKPFFHYYFTHALPGDEEGAFHSAELWYTFGTIKRCWRPLAEADSSLSQVMLDYWTSFAKYGVPKAASLKPWTPIRKTLLFLCVFIVILMEWKVLKKIARYKS